MRPVYVLAGVSLTALTLQGPEQAVFGKWRVTSATCPNVCAMSLTEAEAWRGRTATYSPTLARFGTDSCDSPKYNTGTWGQSVFIGGFRMPASRFGIMADSTTVVDIWCPERLRVPGGFLLVKDARHLLMVWDGIVFELTRNESELPN
jgi:hypothetical protein